MWEAVIVPTTNNGTLLHKEATFQYPKEAFLCVKDHQFYKILQNNNKCQTERKEQ